MGLLIVSAVATIGAVILATNNNVKIQAEEKLAVGQRVFEQLILERGNQLFDSAAVLVADYGFKEAVTSNDMPTIQSALENNGSRINADLILLLGLDGQLINTASDASSQLIKDFSFSALLTSAEKEGGISTIALINDQIYQLVMLPVEAPIVVAWAVVGKHIDNDFANQLKELTNLNVSFGGGRGVDLSVEVSTLTDASIMTTELFSKHDAMYLIHEGIDERFLTLPVELASTAQYRVEALLITSLTEANARFFSLKLQMVLIASVTLLVSVICTFFISRNVTRPIAKLVAAARRISAGDYQQAILPGEGGTDEIGVLSDSFHTMQEGIAQREEQLSFQAFHDGLTGIANRTLIVRRLVELLEDSDVPTVAVMRINVIQFKQVNDTFGYDVGDALLKSLAEILVSSRGDRNLTSRLSADEFAVLLPDLNAEAIGAEVVRLQNAISQPLPINDVNVKINISIGMASYPEDGDQAEQLLRRAEIALNNARDKNLPFVAYESGQDEDHLRQITLVNDLKIALDKNQLAMHYQPKVDVKRGQVTQVEALLRWIHQELGFVSPEEFITLAEQSGLMPSLTDWVLETVFSQALLWQEKGIDIAIAVNLSAYDLVETFPQKVEALLNKKGLTTDRVILEITESAVMQNPEEAIRVLHRLRDIGFNLSIDDYGTGYSSLAQLKNMPVNELKIDKSFVMRLDEDEHDQAIVSSTIELGHNIGLTIVAEGVETLNASRLLEKWGCDKLQGYYISRPIPVEEFEKWLDGYDYTIRENQAM